MRPAELAASIEACIKAKRPAMAWSLPGMGKSTIFGEVAAKLGLGLYDVRFSGRDPVDLLGLPFIKAGKTCWATPNFLPTKGPAILLLDEINRGSQMMLNVGLQLVLDGRCGDCVLPPGVIVMAAGNPESDPGVIRMSSAMRLRLKHLDLDLHHDDWAKWAIANQLEPSVIAFARFRPELLHKFDPKQRTSPSPRGWKFVSDTLLANPDPAIERGLVAGDVGQTAADEFAAFRRLFATLPSIDAILMDPHHAIVPANPGTLYAVSAALARRASPTNIGKIMTYLDRLPGDYNVLCIKTAAGRATEISATPEYNKWAIAHSDLTM